jgi:hypothetical protein
MCHGQRNQVPDIASKRCGAKGPGMIPERSICRFNDRQSLSPDIAARAFVVSDPFPASNEKTPSFSRLRPDDHIVDSIFSAFTRMSA